MLRLQRARGTGDVQSSTGKNVGQFVIVTVNERKQPVLVTTIDTCGRHLHFFPTNYLPNEQYPLGWKVRPHEFSDSDLYPGYTLQADLDEWKHRLAIFIRKTEHHVADVAWVRPQEIQAKYDTCPIALEHISELKKIPFFTSRGYVNNNTKPFEFLLMSWWTLDRHVRRDKALTSPEAKSPMFYTDLTPWGRQPSDMRDFATFLNFWGWRL